MTVEQLKFEPLPDAEVQAVLEEPSLLLQRLALEVLASRIVLAGAVETWGGHSKPLEINTAHLLGMAAEEIMIHQALDRANIPRDSEFPNDLFLRVAGLVRIAGIVVAWEAGGLSEGQAMRALGKDRVSARKIRLAFIDCGKRDAKKG